jgi:hypothetical protein
MPRFPKSEADIFQMASMMVSGFYNYPAIFPSCSVPQLLVARSAYITAQKNQVDAASVYRQATAAKDAGLSELVKIMKSCLQKSLVDTASEPAKMHLIGFGQNNNRYKIEKPYQPASLRAVIQTESSVVLEWKRPQQGGQVSNYIVERRQLLESGNFSRWSITGTCHNEKIELNDQPRGIQLEYRIKAVNKAGSSAPSNTEDVVL